MKHMNASFDILFVRQEVGILCPSTLPTWNCYIWDSYREVPVTQNSLLAEKWDVTTMWGPEVVYLGLESI